MRDVRGERGCYVAESDVGIPGNRGLQYVNHVLCHPLLVQILMDLHQGLVKCVIVNEMVCHGHVLLKGT